MSKFSAVVAKFHVVEINMRDSHTKETQEKYPETKGHQTAEIVLDAVWTDDENSRLKSFAESTPAGNLRMIVDNQSAIPFFVKGKIYDITITPENHTHELAVAEPVADSVDGESLAA